MDFKSNKKKNEINILKINLKNRKIFLNILQNILKARKTLIYYLSTLKPCLTEKI